MGAELEPAASADVATQEAMAAAEALAAEFKSDLSQDEFVVPMLKVVQGSSKNVPGDARSGDFVNALTGEVFGDSIEFVPAAYYKGRFLSRRDEGKSWSASGDVVPENWPEELRGQRFEDLPEAEEVYKQRVNAKEIPWGKGPSIQTTYNFVGFVRGTDVPVRLSFKSTGKSAAQKLKALLRVPAAPWDNAVNLRTHQTENKSGDAYYEVIVERGEETAAEERLTAVQIAQGVKNQRGRFTDDDPIEDDEKVAPRAKSEKALDL
jgi:hypothetical protein